MERSCAILQDFSRFFRIFSGFFAASNENEISAMLQDFSGSSKDYSRIFVGFSGSCRIVSRCFKMLQDFSGSSRFSKDSVGIFQDYLIFLKLLQDFSGSCRILQRFSEIIQDSLRFFACSKYRLMFWDSLGMLHRDAPQIKRSSTGKESEKVKKKEKFQMKDAGSRNIELAILLAS